MNGGGIPFDRGTLTSPRLSLPWTKRDALALAVLCLGAGAALRWLWLPGLTNPNDMLMGIYRLFELDRSWLHHIWYPRLGMDLNFGYGSPLFEYYPPLVSYVALVFVWAGLGYVEAAKAGFSVALALGGLGTFLYARWLLRHRLAALLSGLAYVLAPYLLVDIYQRGAGAELMALGLLPWVFYGLHRLLLEPGRRWACLSALAVALLVLSHNITAFFVVPLAVAFVLGVAAFQRRWRGIPAVALALAAGLALAAFYWLPALAERGYALIESHMLWGDARPETNLLRLRELAQWGLVFDYWGTAPFRLAAWQVVAAVAAVVAIPFADRETRVPLILLAALAALLLCAQLTVSRFFWETAPLVRFIQFPWRLLGPVAFCLALLAGSLVTARPLNGRAGLAVAAALVAVALVAGMWELAPGRARERYPLASTQVNLGDLYARAVNGLPLNDDYLPIWVATDSWQIVQSRPAGNASSVPPLTHAPAVQVLAEAPGELRLHVAFDSAFTLRLPRIYFPGWQVYRNGQRLPTLPAGEFGIVSAQLPPGDAQIVARFEETGLRLTADLLSLLVLLAGAGLAFSSRSRRRYIVVGVGCAGLLVALLLAHQGLGAAPVKPVAQSATLQGEVQLLGYTLPDRAWHAGDTLPLRLYWLGLRAPQGDYKVLLHLTKLDDSGKIAQGDDEPSRGLRPTSRWEPGQVIVDEQQIRLDRSTPPGRYRLVIGMYRQDPVQNLVVTGAERPLPGDRLALTEIEVR